MDKALPYTRIICGFHHLAVNDHIVLNARSSHNLLPSRKRRHAPGASLPPWGLLDPGRFPFAALIPIERSSASHSARMLSRFSHSARSCSSRNSSRIPFGFRSLRQTSFDKAENNTMKDQVQRINLIVCASWVRRRLQPFPENLLNANENFRKLCCRKFICNCIVVKRLDMAQTLLLPFSPILRLLSGVFYLHAIQ